MSKQIKNYDSYFPWDKLPNESEKAHLAFKYYRDLSLPRSIHAVADHTPHTLNTVYRWSKIYSWKDRAKSYDQYLDKKKLEAEVDELEEVKKKQRAIAQNFWSLVNLELSKFLRDSKSRTKSILTSEQIKSLAEFATKLERLNLDEPTENISIRDDRKKLQKLFVQKGIQDTLNLLSDKLAE